MKKTLVMIMIVSSLFLIGCSTHVHTVGTGPETGMTKVARQYYLLWGLIPLNTVDTNQMAASMKTDNYEIKSQIGLVDGAINFASMVTIGGLVSSRTVTITK